MTGAPKPADSVPQEQPQQQSQQPRKKGFWGKLLDSIGNAIGQAKFGD